jgi:hypothetical protein
MRERHFIPWLIGIVLIPFFLDSIPTYIQRFTTVMPMVVLALATVVGVAVLFSLRPERHGSPRESWVRSRNAGLR